MKEQELASRFAKSIKLAEELKQKELEQYANQRVIEELEDLIKEVSTCIEMTDNKGSLDVLNALLSSVNRRIKELKQ